ncbi:MAG: hypothetical protein GX971_12265 [Firmicutes bacterium]|nr:hypothetical protein [Bacillota bacterium]
MAERFVRNLVFALVIFVVVAILVYTKVEFAEPVTEYLAFVVTTDISIQPILEKVDLAEKLPKWDLESWVKGWSNATSGR